MRNHAQSITTEHPFACYDTEQLVGIRNRISMQPELQEEYQRQAALSNAFAEVEASLPIQLISPFRTTPFVLRTPENSVYMTLTLCIRGKGEAWIRQVQLTHSEKGLPVPIASSCFDHGLAGWEASTSTSFNSVCVQPSEDPRLGPCLYVMNMSDDDFVLLTMTDPIPVYAHEHYSIQTTLRLDACFSQDGVSVEVTFLGEDGQPMDGVYTSNSFNRKTPTNWAALLETAGADANAYMVTGDKIYAERAKRKLLYMLPDMCQGMDIFKATGWHDDDTYGAVHIGRGMSVLAVIYDQIAGSGVILAEEDAAIQYHFRYIASMMMDTQYYRFDLEEFPDEKGGKRSNWNADRATGLGIYALIFPDEILAEVYLSHACAVVDWQLEHVVDQDGAWPENIRYHGAVLHRYFLFFTLLQRLRGIDYWSREKVKMMYRFLIGTVTPKDSVQGGADSEAKLLFPAVGDSTVDDQWFRMFAYAAPFYLNSDPQLSREMMWAWKHGGSVVRDTGASPCTLLALLYPRPELPQEAPDLASVHYSGIGYVIFRQHFGQWGQENYAIFESSPLIYHAHHDEGHFSLWANATPLTLDPGTGGYYNGDRHWYVNGHAHNVVQFMDEAGIPQNGPLQSVCEEVVFSDQLDYVRSSIPDVLAENYHRHFAYVKAGGANMYVVWDHIRSQRNSVWHLHTMSTSSVMEKNRITAHCLNEMKLEVTFLEPSRITASTDHGAVSGGYPLAVQEHFRISGDSGGDYLSLLYPKSRESAELTLQIQPLLVASDDSEELRMYRVFQEEQVLFHLVVNGSDKVHTCSVQSDVSLMNLLNKTSYTPESDGQCRIPIDGGRLAILIETD
ncbi:heparinase II/III domain-containing protein [Paenibacillus oryzisoli]|uniref:Heparinase II/III-like C-terminal domain-containing protein n=1 Tax=Paenibacillus oryzisoli TaxID=1850517 RepID=A0A198A8L4_9BACL|nr:heparinase II/III family protein [Paenibacillus oryzisoli]OAS17809.1 hypothetical protein A8708_27685 [Paenibacillus oryzisoli]